MLSRSHRFHGLGSLNFAYRYGQTARGQFMNMRFALNPRRKTYRAAVVVSRKVSKSAVVRNRVRRRVYEALQSRAAGIKGPYDLVFTVNNDEAASCEFAELERQVENLLKKAEVPMAGRGGHDIVSTEGK